MYYYYGRPYLFSPLCTLSYNIMLYYKQTNKNENTRYHCVAIPWHMTNTQQRECVWESKKEEEEEKEMRERKKKQWYLSQSLQECPQLGAVMQLSCSISKITKYKAQWHTESSVQVAIMCEVRLTSVQDHVVWILLYFLKDFPNKRYSGFM